MAYYDRADNVSSVAVPAADGCVPVLLRAGVVGHGRPAVGSVVAVVAYDTFAC